MPINGAMQISSTTLTIGAAPGAGAANSLDKLQKQLRELSEELQSVAVQDMDPKTKRERVKLLQVQIQMVQAQIEAIHRQTQQEQLERQRQADAKKEAAAPTASGKSKPPGLGGTVDTFV